MVMMMMAMMMMMMAMLRAGRVLVGQLNLGLLARGGGAAPGAPRLVYIAQVGGGRAVGRAVGPRLGWGQARVLPCVCWLCLLCKPLAATM